MDRTEVPMRLRVPHPCVWAALFAIAAALALTVDLDIARRAPHHGVLGDVRRALDISEVFAHGCGVLMILVTAAVLDPSNRRRLVRVGACAFGAGVLVQVIKHLVPRIRPHAFGSDESVLSTFLSWREVAADQGATLSGSVIQSFPSGHTATAVGLAYGLTWLYPRGRWLFALFAALAAAQRIESSAHYLSDTFAAAAIASLVAACCLGQRGAGSLFARFERSREPVKSCASVEPRTMQGDQPARGRAA